MTGSLSQEAAEEPRPVESLPPGLGSARPLHISPDLEGVETPWGETGASAMGLVPNSTQRLLWQLLEARRPDGRPRHEESGVQVPRRAGKTEGLLAEAVGRCISIPGYEVLYAAQSGAKSRERFKGLFARLNRADKAHKVARLTDDGVTDRSWRPRLSNGEEQVEWGNGSVLRFRPPLPSSFRGDAVDLLILDEAQEHNLEETTDLVAAALPLMDTREDPQTVITGTPAPQREGLLWSALELGREGTNGIMEFAAPDDADLDDEQVWIATHPGPAGVSPERGMEVLRNRRERLGSAAFGMEYLGRWPETVTRASFSEELWEACGVPMVERPAVCGLAYDVAPDASRASVAAAWRDSEGVAYVGLIAVSTGTAWVLPKLLEMIRGRRGAHIGYDAVGGGTLALADVLGRDRLPKTLAGLTTAKYVAACSTFASGVIDGQLRHFNQPDLTEAVAAAHRRPIGDSGWGWGRRGSDADITPLVAATVALKTFDDMPKARSLQVLSAS